MGLRSARQGSCINKPIIGIRTSYALVPYYTVLFYCFYFDVCPFEAEGA